MSLLTPLHAMGITPVATGIRLGMPHLSPTGLSETWLLKHLGDVHWQLLTQRLGRPAAQIEDREGNRVYAAFRHVLLDDARLHMAREDGHLSVTSSLWRFSRTQFLSRHALIHDGRPMGGVTLISAFIRREGRGNHRVSRVEVPGLAALPMWDGARPQIMGALATTEGASRFTFQPTPAEDFNGAGFLYFPAYVAIAERAAFAADAAFEAHATTVQREVCYHANINLGDAVEVTTLASAQGPARLQQAGLRRLEDGVLLAVITTRKLTHT